MENFSERQIKILSLLINSQTELNSTYLADEFNITRRTLIKDIQLINSGKSLIISSNRGYKINPIYTNSINEYLITYENQYSYNYKILKLLLSSKDKISITNLSNQLFISESTLTKYINSINNEIIDYNLSIIREKGFLLIQGNENNKRGLLSRIIHRESYSFFSDIENFKSYFPNIDVSEISKEVIKVILDYSYTIPKYYEINFLINVLVILSRNPFLISQEQEDIMLTSSSFVSRKIAYAIINSLESKYNIHYLNKIITIKELEQALDGFIQPMGKNPSAPVASDLSETFKRNIRSIVEEVFNYYYLTTINYNDFISLFCIHVSELIKRCGNSINFVPTNYSIKHYSPYIYEIAVSICEKIAQEYKIIIPDCEINLVAVHIGYTVEQATASSNVAPIIIIDSNYRGSSKSIADKMAKEFPSKIQIVGLYNTLSEIPYYQLKSSLIISTIQCQESSLSICYISPLFNDFDLKRVQQQVDLFINKRLEEQTKMLINQFVSPGTFFVIDKKMGKTECIEFLVDKAIKNRDVSADFLQQVLHREKLSSTAFFGKFAIPHSNIQNAYSNKLYIMINRQGVSWDNQNIKIIFLILIKGNAMDEFRSLYTCLTETLYKNNDIFKNINHINNVDDMLKYLFQFN